VEVQPGRQAITQAIMIAADFGWQDEEGSLVDMKCSLTERIRRCEERARGGEKLAADERRGLGDRGVGDRGVDELTYRNPGVDA